MKISAVIISRNEENNIGDCIRSLEFADEVVVIDNYSSDKTQEIAKGLGAKVYTISAKDFSYFRNVGKEKARHEWLFYIDADERVSPDLAKEIKQSIEKKEMSGYEVPRKNYFFGRSTPRLEYMLRLMRKDNLLGWQGVIHETAMVNGKIGRLTHPILHYTHSDLSSMLAKTNEWSDFEAQLRFMSNHPRMTWWRFFRVMSTSFWDSYMKQGLWRLGTVGLIESIYQSFSMFVTYAKLWEKQNTISRRKHS